jgi:hypothetical protein
MEKKTAGTNAQQRIYMLGRFRKAVKWASLFSQLCSLKGDSRTSLEAEVCLLLYFVSLFFSSRLLIRFCTNVVNGFNFKLKYLCSKYVFTGLCIIYERCFVF